MSEAAKCRSCQASIFWLKNAGSGKLAPIDAAPSADGNIVIEGDSYRVLAKDLFAQPADGPRHKNHFATCPNAAKHHKEKK